MKQRPLILISPDIESKGKEFGDLSISSSGKYEEAVVAAGGLPLTMPATTSRQLVAECIRRADGILLTGGDDVDPRLYGNGLPKRALRTVDVTPDGGQRDYRELLVIDEVFRQRKPLLAICRGHQILNVALGGTLIADIPTQVPDALDHRRTDRKHEIVHQVRLTPGSILAKITGRQKLGVNSTHHQAVGQVADPLQVAAIGADGVIEGLELKPGGSRWLPMLLSVQFHPERLMDRYREHAAIFRVFTRACALNR
jgi:putative glutamine amidotransferase